MLILLTLICCFMVGCQDKVAIAELEEFKAQAVVEEQNKELVHELYAAIDMGDFDKLKELIAGDIALNAPGLPEPVGADVLFKIIKAHYTSFPDWKHVIEATLAEGDMVAVKLTQNGTQMAEYEGIPSSEIKATLPAMHLVKIVDGKVIEWYAIEDYLGLYIQLGMELKQKEDKK